MSSDIEIDVSNQPVEGTVGNVLVVRGLDRLTEAVGAHWPPSGRRSDRTSSATKNLIGAVKIKGVKSF